MKIEVNNYGELLAFVFKKKLIAYETYGSYQGDYIAILDSGDSIEVWKGCYGSCSGCDWLEAQYDELTEESAKEYVRDERPFLEIKKDIMRNISLEDFRTLLPANTRFDWDYEKEESEIEKEFFELVMQAAKQ